MRSRGSKTRQDGLEGLAHIQGLCIHMRTNIHHIQTQPRTRNSSVAQRSQQRDGSSRDTHKLKHTLTNKHTATHKEGVCRPEILTKAQGQQNYGWLLMRVLWVSICCGHSLGPLRLLWCARLAVCCLSAPALNEVATTHQCASLSSSASRYDAYMCIRALYSCLLLLTNCGNAHVQINTLPCSKTHTRN